MSLIAMLIGGLRMLLRTSRVFLALGVVALAVMFSGGTMCLGRVFVVFGCLVVFVSCHIKPRSLLASNWRKTRTFEGCSFGFAAQYQNCSHRRRVVSGIIEFSIAS